MKRLRPAVLALLFVSWGTVCLYGALSDPVTPNRPAPSVPGVTYVIPVSTITDWITVCSDPLTSDNSGSTIINPALITRTAQRKMKLIKGGTTVPVRLKYLTSGTVTTSPVVQIFGFDSTGAPERLVDSTAAHALTLTVDTVNDARDGTYSYTQPVEVDASANSDIMVAVKTALGGSSLTNSVIQAKVK